MEDCKDKEYLQNCGIGFDSCVNGPMNIRLVATYTRISIKAVIPRRFAAYTGMSPSKHARTAVEKHANWIAAIQMAATVVQPQCSASS